MTVLPSDYFSSIHTCHPTFHFLKSFKNLLLLKREPENERVINGILWLTFRRPNRQVIDEMTTGLSRRSASIIRLLLPMVLTNQLSHWPSLLLCNNFKAKTYDWLHDKPPFCDTHCAVTKARHKYWFQNDHDLTSDMTVLNHGGSLFITFPPDPSQRPAGALPEVTWMALLTAPLTGPEIHHYFLFLVFKMGVIKPTCQPSRI